MSMMSRYERLAELREEFAAAGSGNRLWQR